MSKTIIGFKPPERPMFPTHLQYTGDNKLLSPPEVELIREWCDSQPLQDGTIGNGDAGQQRLDADYRTVKTCALEQMKFQWLYDRLAERIQWANDAHFRFTLSGFAEPIGYLRYDTPDAADESGSAGHYDWHQDFGGGPFAGRKLSLVIQLSNPDEYDDCELMLCNDGPWVVPYKDAGDAILFPSWTPHCVTHISRGCRRALVLWVSGPQFQ